METSSSAGAGPRPQPPQPATAQDLTAQPVAAGPAPPRPSGRVDARAAVADSVSVGLAFVPLGLALGVLVTQSGLPWWCATLFAAVIYAGSFEFLLVGLAAAATPLGVVALTALTVNVRHVFYALSFPLHRVNGRLARSYSAFAMCDEAYALTTSTRARTWSGARILWLQALLHTYWVSGATAGALLGSLIPGNLRGLDFALTALFTVLALDAVRERRHDLPTPLLALLSALIARLVLPDHMLPAAFTLFTAAALTQHLIIRRRPVHA